MKTDRFFFRDGGKQVWKNLFVGKSDRALREFKDRFIPRSPTVKPEPNGWVKFLVRADSNTDPTSAVSVWVER